MAKKIIYTAHADHAIFERNLDRSLIELTVLKPEWSAVDPHKDGRTRHYKQFSEIGGRILRVVVVESDQEFRIVSAFIDRKARRPE
jgi:hypothetical protein